MSENIHLELLETDKEIRDFFSNDANERFLFVTYEEYLKIFGLPANPFYLPSINKKIIYGHLDYFNQSYDEIWEWKWLPLIMKFLFNTVRLKPTSILLSAIYLFSIDYFFEQFAIFTCFYKRNINIKALFNYQLTKEKFLKIRESYINKYLSIVNEKKEEFEQFDFKNVDSAIYAGTTSFKIDSINSKDEQYRIGKNYLFKRYLDLKSSNSETLREKVSQILTQIGSLKNAFPSYKQNYSNLPSRK